MENSRPVSRSLLGDRNHTGTTIVHTSAIHMYPAVIISERSVRSIFIEEIRPYPSFYPAPPRSRAVHRPIGQWKHDFEDRRPDEYAARMESPYNRREDFNFRGRTTAWGRVKALMVVRSSPARARFQVAVTSNSHFPTGRFSVPAAVTFRGNTQTSGTTNGSARQAVYRPASER